MQRTCVGSFSDPQYRADKDAPAIRGYFPALRLASHIVATCSPLMMMLPLFTVLSPNTLSIGTVFFVISGEALVGSSLGTRFFIWGLAPADDHCNGPPLLTVILTSWLLLLSSGSAPQISSAAMMRLTSSVGASSKYVITSVSWELSAEQTCTCPFPLRPIRRPYLN